MEPVEIFFAIIAIGTVITMTVSWWIVEQVSSINDFEETDREETSEDF